MMAARSPASLRLDDLLAGCPVGVSGRAADVPVAWPAAWQELTVDSLASDSRDVRPGAVFCAVRGTRMHGARFVDDAIRRGAAAVIIDQHHALPACAVPVLIIPDLQDRLSGIAARLYAEPSRSLEIFAVTGTNGKTTVAHLLADLLGHLHQRRCAYIGTLGSGTIGSLRAGALTTPDAISVQRQLAEFRYQGIRSVALEASSHALAQGRLNAINIHGAVFTNLTRDHLDYHLTMDDYRAAKERVFELPGIRFGVFNISDPAVAALYAEHAQRLESWSYSAASGTSERPAVRRLRHIHIDVLTESADGMELGIDAGGTFQQLSVPFIGMHNASNLAAVIAVASGLDLAPDAILNSLPSLRQVPGRMQRIGASRPAVYVDYAHTPDALLHVLTALRRITRGKLWCVFGCGGDRDPGKRPLMGAVAERHADHVVITSDNPRTEDPESITVDICSGLLEPKTAMVVLDRRDAIARAIDRAAGDDVILVAGKGHEATQQLADRVIEFRDADVIHALLAERGR